MEGWMDGMWDRVGWKVDYGCFTAHLLLFDAYSKVRLVELVRNIPTKRTKFTPLLNKTMKEA